MGEAIEPLNVDEFIGELGVGMSFQFPTGKRIEVALPLYLTDPENGDDSWAMRAVIGFSVP